MKGIAEEGIEIGQLVTYNQVNGHVKLFKKNKHNNISTIHIANSEIGFHTFKAAVIKIDRGGYNDLDSDNVIETPLRPFFLELDLSESEFDIEYINKCINDKIICTVTKENIISEKVYSGNGILYSLRDNILIINGTNMSDISAW